MAATLENIVGRWLRRMTISVSPHFLREKMQSHPDYPSLRSISDVLDELQIDNAALQIDKDRLQEAPLSFLAHDAARSEFVIIENADREVKQNPDFEKNWNGTALLAEKPDNWRHAENEKRLTEERKSVKTLSATLIFILGLAVLCLMNGFNWQVAGLLAVTFAGIAIGILIVQQELGISNELTEKLCHAGKNTDCGAVMHSKGSRLGRWLNWADAGLIYFTAYSLLLLTALYNNNTGSINLLALLSIVPIPFTFFSLYYQWRVVKRWCSLCLITVALLWLQFALSLPVVTLRLSKGEFWAADSFNSISFSAFVFAVISAAWLLLLKPLLEKNNQLQTRNFSLLRFKNNPLLFETLLLQQRQADTTPLEHDLQLGNANAPLQILVACNPYCGPCALAHETLHKLLERNDIGLTVRFTIKNGNKEDKKIEAAAYMLRLVDNKNATYKKQVLHDWYALMNIEKFMAKYLLVENDTDVTEQLWQQEQWSEKAEIKFTPTIFINGYELPKQYTVNDLAGMLRDINIKTEKTAQPVENNYAPA